MSEYDETQLFPDMRLARILLERLGKNSLSVSVEVAAEKILDAQHTIADKDAEIARLNKRTDDLVGLFIGDDHESPLGKKVMSVLAPMAVDEESELEKVWADVKAIGVGYLYKSKRIDPVLLYAYGSKDTVSIDRELLVDISETTDIGVARALARKALEVQGE